MWDLKLYRKVKIYCLSILTNYAKNGREEVSFLWRVDACYFSFAKYIPLLAGILEAFRYKSYLTFDLTKHRFLSSPHRDWQGQKSGTRYICWWDNYNTGNKPKEKRGKTWYQHHNKKVIKSKKQRDIVRSPGFNFLLLRTVIRLNEDLTFRYNSYFPE